jgi:hypothetical protein
MRSWSDFVAAFACRAALVVVVLAPIGTASACPPGAASNPSTTIWGYEFVELFAHQGISSLTHRDDMERIDLTVIRDVAPEVASAFIDDEISLFDSLFTLKRTGYPGQITRYIECPPELRPQYGEGLVDGNTIRYFRAFANANFVAGVPTLDLAAYRLLKGYLFCRELGVVLEIEHFSPMEGDDLGAAFLDRLACPTALP